MKSLHLGLGCVLFASSALSQFLEPPPTTADPNTLPECSWWHVASGGDTCEDLSTTWGITVDTLALWNPTLAGGCNFVLGNSYCIEKNYGMPDPEPTSTTSAAAPTSTGNGVATPTPVSDGVTKTCAKFHAVVKGDGCASILQQHGISFDQLFAWNPAVGSNCEMLQLGVNYCVALIGGTPITSSPPTTTTPANGVVTPTPFPDNSATNCNKFHLVVQGEGCASVLAKNSIAFAQFYAWNPAVGSNCELLQLNVNYCVGVIGGSPTSSVPATTTPANGIVTPTPIPDTTVKNCNKFHFVVQGEGCASVLAKNTIAFAQFYAWNPAVGSNCELLQLGVNYCVGVIGGSPTTTAAATTTTPANGIVTPTPYPDNSVTNCKKFHLVVQNQACSTIYTTNTITFAQFLAWNPSVGSNCELLQLGVNYCVGVIGASPTTTAPPTVTTPANGIVTPTPIMDQMTKNCNKFHFVVSGDGCAAIGTKYSVSFAQLLTWNPAIGSNCEFLQLGVNVCVGVIGGTTTTIPKPSSTTSKGNGIATPTPIREGMTTTCTQFHFVASGDTCATLGTKYGFTFAQMLAWNPSVGSDCGGLWLKTYFCVKATGGPTAAPTTTLKTVTTTATKGNGVATPTPTMPGMVTNCKSFYKVVSGDGCQTIADKYKITLANFKKWNTGVGNNCELMWLNAYVCVAVL